MMWTMRILAALALAAGFILPARAADGPAATVEAIYAAAVKAQADKKAPDPVNDPGLRQKFFSAAVVAAIKADAAAAEKSGDIPGLDFDPVSDSQDPQVRDVKIVPGKAEGSKASVAVSFRNGSARTRLTYALVLEGGAWRVDDIVKPDPDGWSLRAILAGDQ